MTEVPVSTEVLDFFVVFHVGDGDMRINKWNGIEADVLRKAREILKEPGQHVRIYRAEKIVHYTLKAVDAHE